MIALEHQQGSYLEISFGGKLTKQDYETCLPVLEKAIAEHGKLRLLLVAKDFEGISLDAMFKDLRWDWKHRDDVEKCAVVAGGTMMKVATGLGALLYSGEMKQFEPAQLDEARKWVQQ